jgi:hypothetical protein
LHQLRLLGFLLCQLALLAISAIGGCTKIFGENGIQIRTVGVARENVQPQLSGSPVSISTCITYEIYSSHFYDFIHLNEICIWPLLWDNRKTLRQSTNYENHQVQPFCRQYIYYLCLALQDSCRVYFYFTIIYNSCSLPS